MKRCIPSGEILTDCEGEGSCVTPSIIEDISIYTIKEGENVSIEEGFTLKLINLSHGSHQEIYYGIYYDAGGMGSGNIGLGSMSLRYRSVIDKYLIINPVFRNTTHAIFKLMKCQNISCLDESCGDYCFNDIRYYGGEYHSWLPNVERAVCHNYESEICPYGCSDGKCAASSK